MEEYKNNGSGLKTFGKTIANVFLVVIVFSVGYVFGYKGFYANFTKFPIVTISRENPPELEELDFSLFWKVWDTVEMRYFDKGKVVHANMVYGAIQGMVSSMGDPYTIFLPPQQNKVVQEDLNGAFSGVGIQIGFKGTQLAVIAPLPGSPAEKVGLRAGDLIIGIKDDLKGVDLGTNSMSLPEAVRLIRGEEGTMVTLTIIRESLQEPKEFEVIRQAISVPSIEFELVGENQDIGYIQVIKFASETKQEWSDAVVEILKNNQITGVIVDVRNNPGGFLDGAVDLATDFLEIGDIVVVEEETGQPKVEDKVEELGRLRDKKIVILINGGSASASEIFSGALRDYEKAILVGETSFGKGTIQESQQIDGGAGLHITIAKWLTPNGIWVNENPLVPDFELEDDPNTEEDEQLLKAIEVINNL